MSTLTLTNNKKIPMLGLGTWTVGEAVQHALKHGYRHIDCAFVYANEKEIGEALGPALEENNLRREDVFITSKCWCTYLRPELVKICCERSLRDLKLSYVDLYLIHWPVALKPGDINFPKDDRGNLLIDEVSLVDTWKNPVSRLIACSRDGVFLDTNWAMEQLVDAGMVKSIGLSNFNRRQIDLIMNNCRIEPVNLQVEIHANFPNTKLVSYAQSKGLTVTAYAPLGSPSASPGQTDLRSESWVVDIAKKHNKTPSQVLLRYLLQRQLIVIPKSVTASHIEENSKIFDFKLSDEEMKIMDGSGLNERQFKLLSMKPSPEYPFDDEY